MCAWQYQQYDANHRQPWQSPQNGRSSWQDPRFTNQNSHIASPPVAQSPLNPVQAYNIPTAPSSSGLGVRYHQLQQSGLSSSNKPPLPPRPPSGLAHTPSPAPLAGGPIWQASIWQNPVLQPQSGYVQGSGYDLGQQWSSGAFSNQQPHSHSNYQPPLQSPAPPAPPPRPPAYQSQAQPDSLQWPHQQTLHYASPLQQDQEDHPQPHNFSQPNQIEQPYLENRPITQYPLTSNETQNHHNDQQPPVSPEVTHAVSWVSEPPVLPANQHVSIESGSSALGAGGPSDWEHFQASAGDVEDEGTNTANAEDRLGKFAVNDAYAELPTDSSQTAPKQESSGHAPMQRTQSTSSVSVVGEAQAREHSVSPEPSINGLRRTGTIDGVIQAWSTPLQSNITPGESRKSSVSTLDRSRRDAFDSIRSSSGQALRDSPENRDQQGALESNQIIQPDQQHSTSPSNVPVRQDSIAPPSLSTKIIDRDPYADLGPEYRASLARYVTMLRKEEAAPEEERYEIFRAFVLKESRLRSILYAVDADDTDIWNPARARAKKTESTNVVAAPSQTNAPGASQSLPLQVGISEAPQLASDSSPRLKIDTNTAVNEESFVVVERDDQSEYSPGGRPRMPRRVPQRTVSHPAPAPTQKATSSPSDYAPIVVDELMRSPINKVLAAKESLPLRPGTAPLLMQSSAINNPIKFEPPRPAYTPFRYAEGLQRSSEQHVIARPAYEAYSALRHQSVDSGRILAQGTADLISPIRRDTPVSANGRVVRSEHEEAFLGLIREKSRVYRKGKLGKAAGPLAEEPMPLPKLVDRQTRAVNGLRTFIPRIMPQQRQRSHKILEQEREMNRFPDIFTWIPETVVKWDRQNRVIRKKQEDERQARQEESGKNIDALFNEHEIGYSDIGQLELEFKLAEATRRYDEDVQELDSFTDQVFNPVTERLKEELIHLKAQYMRAVDVLDLDSDSGSQYIQRNDDRMSRSEALTILLALYEKMQIRHVKIAEAHYERERRRKKLELSVLYTNGDSEAVKKLEQEFSKAERQQALHEAREKDSRANELMDTFDRATVRGLGDNQQFIDDVSAGLSSINDLLKERPENAKELLLAGLHETLRSIEELLDYVANDSKSLLMLSNKVDNMLNSADYDVSVAEARVSNATQASMKLLQEEKGREDERIKAEVDTRMGSVAKGPENALFLLKSIIKRTGDDPQHQDRVQKALEAAKLRNASKTPVG
ncbi:hypothetical protein EPUS_01320 [Endocarpon pusillum Z07020]|uniref:Uncharacterized protein n=1 Tax=Endocarpon pusillum (strain Z07020 / HMAS-L-300199) TaxID=1263415 RepID=U1I1Y1_ENDPU|nr:uncharacterized protein EPUS_01320 [Endocarpon pusillum Z07020]ERF75954.1 hypothetical protein EPUS_01320 [Endocarpon pusillum Z07020]